jgi:hypothetical protein
MKCKACSKIIPDGFTDCPWCGASFAAAAVTNSSTYTYAAPALAVSSTQNLLIAASIVSSGLLLVLLNYFAATRNAGPLSLENSGYFVGRCVGSILLAAIIVVGYGRIRGKTPRRPVQALIILTVSSLLTVLTLALPARPRMKGIDPGTVRRYSDVPGSSHAPNMPPAVHTKWDSANRSLMQDIATRNQQYVSEISALDETAKPLYTPESFRDAATIQQMIDQLHTRLTVADKYSDWRPVFSRMRDYVTAVDTSEDDKRKFMADYEASVPRTLAVCKLISDKEHAWLQASLDLYQFALSKEGSFAWQNNNLTFRKRADSNVFSKKFFKARTLNTEFLKAYWEVRQAQEAMMAQLGMPEANVGPASTQ